MSKVGNVGVCGVCGEHTDNHEPDCAIRIRESLDKINNIRLRKSKPRIELDV